MERERRERDQAPKQNWGQGEGAHQPTIPGNEESEATPKDESGTSAATADPDGQAREDEGMDR